MRAHHSYSKVVGEFWAQEEAEALCPTVDTHSQVIPFVNVCEMVMDGDKPAAKSGTAPYAGTRAP